MKPEEIMPDVHSESIIKIADDQCLTLTQFREIVTGAAILMKANYVRFLVDKGCRSFISDMERYYKISGAGDLVSHEGLLYKNEEAGGYHTTASFSCFSSGEDCKILQPGGIWQEGRFRVQVTTEFIPNEPEIISTDRPVENSLDDFREIS